MKPKETWKAYEARTVPLNISRPDAETPSYSSICDLDMIFISGLPLYRLIVPLICTFLPSRAERLGSLASGESFGTQPVKVWFG